jgi:hypothetical protein
MGNCPAVPLAVGQLKESAQQRSQYRYDLSIPLCGYNGNAKYKTLILERGRQTSLGQGRIYTN